MRVPEGTFSLAVGYSVAQPELQAEVKFPGIPGLLPNDVPITLKIPPHEAELDVEEIPAYSNDTARPV